MGIGQKQVVLLYFPRYCTFVSPQEKMLFLSFTLYVSAVVHIQSYTACFTYYKGGN